MPIVVGLILLVGLAFPFLWLFGDLEFSAIGLTISICVYLFASWAIWLFVDMLRDVTKETDADKVGVSILLMMGLIFLTVAIMLVIHGRDQELFWHGVVITGLFASGLLGTAAYQYALLRKTR